MLPSLSESLKMMADYKYIYEEDQEEYLKFCSIDTEENLRRRTHLPELQNSDKTGVPLGMYGSHQVQNINRMTRLP